MVLLIVDTQKLITTPNLYTFNVFEGAVKTLIAAARENNVEVKGQACRSIWRKRISVQ